MRNRKCSFVLFVAQGIFQIPRAQVIFQKRIFPQNAQELDRWDSGDTLTKLHHMLMYFIRENTARFHLNAEELCFLQHINWNTYLNNTLRNIAEVLFGFCSMPEYMALLRSFPITSVFFCFQQLGLCSLLLFLFLSGSWQFVIFLLTKGLLHTSFLHTMTASLHKLLVTAHTEYKIFPCTIHANKLCSWGQSLITSKLFWLVSCKPSPCPAPSPCPCNSVVISEEIGKEVNLGTRGWSESPVKMAWCWIPLCICMCFSDTEQNQSARPTAPYIWRNHKNT